MIDLLVRLTLTYQSIKAYNTAMKAAEIRWTGSKAAAKQIHEKKEDNILNEEQIAKAREAKSAEELLALAKENGMGMTEEEAADLYERLHSSTELTDEELENVAGGCGKTNKSVNYSDPACESYVYDSKKSMYKEGICASCKYRGGGIGKSDYQCYL